ncbi:ABC transporter ATP-binding protein [Dermabacteraceae bacterium CCM 9519]
MAKEMSVAQLIAPAKKDMIVTGALTAIGAAVSIVPYICLTEIAAAYARGERGGAIWWWGYLAIAAIVLAPLLYTVGLGLTHIAEANLRYNLRRRLVDALGKMPLGRVFSTPPGKVRKIVADDTSAIHVLVAHLSGDATYAVVSLILGVGYLLWVDWRLTLLLLLIWVLVIGGLMVTSQWRYGESVKRFSLAQNELSAAAAELVEGIREVKTFQGAQAPRTRFNAAHKGFSDLSYEWSKSVGMAMAVLAAFLKPGVIFATVAPLAVWFVAQGWTEPAYTLPFFMLALGIPSGLLQLMVLAQSLYEARQAAQDTVSVLSVPPIKEGAGRQEAGPKPGEVSFSDVSFSYTADRERPLLHDLSFTAPAGSVTALVGPSGGGKSTLVKLIARFHDVDSGSVKVEGLDVREVTSRWLLSRVAVVFQDVALVHDTVANNIALGRTDATREEIEAAARAACLHERITRLKDGYDTVIGDDDGILSGGEMQRLTIARAYLQDAPILVLDEATAMADPRSEREIHRALSELARQRTVIVIAHRLSTVREADQILVVAGGTIAERGKHEELVAEGGIYASLWHRQQGEGDEK